MFQRLPLAHTIEGVDVLPAVAFTLESGIAIVFVDSLSRQVREPRLDIASRDKDRHAFIRLPSFLSRFEAGAFNLFYPSGNLSPVGIDKHNQRLLDPVLSCSVIGQFLPEPFPHELFARSTAFRADFDSLYPDVLARAFQEPSGKRLVLPVFAQDDDLNVPPHCSHPRAITSDSLSPPSTAISLAECTVVTPELPGLRTIPRSPPR